MSLGWYSQLYTFCTFRMYILPRKLNVPLREPFLVTFILKGIYFVPFNVYVLPAQMHKVHLVRVKSSLNNKHQRPFQFFKIHYSHVTVLKHKELHTTGTNDVLM